MTAARTRSALLALQQCTDPRKAERLLARIPDPSARAAARREWAELQAASVTVLEEAR